MPTLNIKDPAVYELARELADRTHTSMTGAVRTALTEAIARAPKRPRATVEELLALADELRTEMLAAGGRFLDDDEIYDERGLPR